MKFEKYHCLENDFIIMEETPLNIKELCDQHKSIGADGLIIIDNLNIIFFNKDGTKAKFCGNAIRCAAKYINTHYDCNKILFNFENDEYTITHTGDFYKLKFNIPKFKKIKNYYLVNASVDHLVVLQPPKLNKAIKLFNKYQMNITFYFDGKATTYERGVGFTRGCGSGLIAIMTILNYKYNITSRIIESEDLSSRLKVRNNFIYLTSEVFYTYKGEI